MIFQRSLLREFGHLAFAVFATLFAITLTTQLIRFLGQAAGGKVQSESVLALLGFSALNYLPVLLSLTLFVTVLMTLSRSYRDSEMVIWFGSGLSLTAWIRPVLAFAAPLVLMIAILSLFLSPWATGKSEDYRRQMETRDDASRVAPGIFREAGSADRVFFVEEIAGDETNVQNVFIAQMREGKLAVMVSKRGYREVAANGDRFVVLQNGRRYDGAPGTTDYKVMDFERYAIRIETRDTKEEQSSTKAMSTLDLLKQRTSGNLAELLWRIGLPLSALTLSLLAIPLSFVNPRASRSVNLIFALLTYMVYSNLISIAQAWVSQGRLSFTTGWWVVHAVMFLVLVLMFYRRLRVGPLLGTALVETLRRYLAKEIYGATLFVFAAFLGLFAFFDLIYEMGELGKGQYKLQHALAFVALSVPSHVYELFPIAVLIGTLYALSHLASNSEYTVMRGSGLSPWRASLMLFHIGIAFVVGTLIFGELVTPAAERAARKLKLAATTGVVAQEFRTGLWVKDDRRFVNVREILPDTTLSDVRVYEFDSEYRLVSVSFAEHARYAKNNVWRLTDVQQTRFAAGGSSVQRIPELEWTSVLTPEILSVLFVLPERMSAWNLFQYTQHLAENRQKTERYEIAMWKKLVYPFASLVMMYLALPFAYVHTRAGGVGVKVFSGIMLGILFHMLNSLFSHLGLLQNWRPLYSAVLPSLLFLATAASMMWWVERR